MRHPHPWRVAGVQAAKLKAAKREAAARAALARYYADHELNKAIRREKYALKRRNK